jgi:1,4-dihydroxy-2-naphthoate octaprenyltransferase
MGLLNIRKWILLSLFLVALFFYCSATINAQQTSNTETDRRAGKHTLAVLIGTQSTRADYALLLAVAYTIPQIRLVWQKPGGSILNQLLAATAILALFFSLLLSIGLILSAN